MAVLRLLLVCVLVGGVLVASQNSCPSGRNYCYDAAGTTLTCCVSTCDNCDLATGLIPGKSTNGESSFTLHSVRTATPGPRHGAFQEYGGADATLDDGFNFSLDFFTALPANLDNYTQAEVAGVAQGRCFITAIGGSTLPFPPPSLECIQTFYFITSFDGTYVDALTTHSLFLLAGTGNNPLIVTGGAGKFKYVGGEAQQSAGPTSPSGNHVYDTYSFTVKSF